MPVALEPASASTLIYLWTEQEYLARVDSVARHSRRHEGHGLEHHFSPASQATP